MAPTNDGKRVTFMLEHNIIQTAVEDFLLVRSSPQVPWDSAKRPGKTVLKPNLKPIPINYDYNYEID